MEAVALALAAGYQLEKADADLTKEPWPRLGEHLQALGTERHNEALSALEAIESRLARQPPLSLISADADQIQAYVFESAKIPEVRGASALVEWLNFEGLKEVVRRFGLTEDVLVYQGGGAMLLVPAVIADNVWQAIEEQFVATTHVATVTAVSRVVSMRDLLERDRFQKVRTALMHDLQITKLRKGAPVHFEWLPMARRCQACEVRPASAIYTASADRPLLCEACKAKREKGYTQRLPFRFHDYLLEQPQNGTPLPYLTDVRLENPTPERIINHVDHAEDLHELSYNGYVGVIAADGDGVGGILTQLDSLAEFAHFSQNLYRLSNESVFEPLAACLKVVYRQSPLAGQTLWFHPFELVALGGDDLFLIVPANKALTIAQSITDYWRKHAIGTIPENRRSGANKLDPPSLSLGLLICPDTFPLYFMHQLAEQLLQHAKAARSKARAPEGFVDFLILKSSGTLRTEARQVQEVLYRYQERGPYGETTLHLTERPHALTAFSNLVQTAVTLKQTGMTRTQRHTLARSLRLGRLRSTMDVLLYWARRPAEDERGERIRQCLKEWFEYLQRVSRGTLVFPWRQDDRRRQETWTTQLLDILELMEWVEAKESNATENDGGVGGSDTA